MIKSLYYFLKKFCSFQKISSLLNFHPLFISNFQVKEIQSILPREIIEDILSRLPVKSLLQFKCVSKSWRSLISDQCFIERHLHRSNKSSNCLLVPGRYATYLVDSNTGQQIVKFDNLPLISTGTIWGSCNGVLYIQVENEHTFFLCNPSTRECKKLPEPSLYPASLDLFTGFGYNTICKDYIVVRIFCREPRMEAEVYSLAKNSWRVIQPVDYRITAGKRNGIFFNNAFHWVGTPSTTNKNGSGLASKFVIAFDTMSDEFRAVVQLHPDVAEDSCCIQLEVIDGCLCLLCNFDYEDFVKFEVWVMKDYGLRKSWVKLYTVTGFDHPYGITNTGNFITHKLYSGLYDPQDRSYRDINVQGIHNPIVNYTESLVPLC